MRKLRLRLPPSGQPASYEFLMPLLAAMFCPHQLTASPPPTPGSSPMPTPILTTSWFPPVQCPAANFPSATAMYLCPPRTTCRVVAWLGLRHHTKPYLPVRSNIKPCTLYGIVYFYIANLHITASDTRTFYIRLHMS